MPQPPKGRRQFQDLVQVIEALRGPDGCPWDKEQTHQSLTRFAIEEAAEFAHAAEAGSPQEICEELGDLLLQVVLNAEIARQEGSFTIEDVIASITEKMIRRHPHVFGDTKVNDASAVRLNWQKLKAEEKSEPMVSGFRFDLPPQLPALLTAFKIGEKTKTFHFDWSKPREVLAKVEEELNELKVEIDRSEAHRDERSEADLALELGDLLFSVAQLARHLGLEPEQCLRQANRKFERRFSNMLDRITVANRKVLDLNPAELEEFWRQTKLAEEKT